MLRKCEASSRNVQTDTETGSEGAHALSEALSFNTTLKVLKLGCAKKNAKFDTTPTNTATKKEQTANKLGGEGAKELGNALKTNSTLKTLNLFGG